jgi:hypothetical protein
LPHRTAAGRILLALVVVTASVLVWNVAVIRNAADAFDKPRGSIVTNREASAMEFTTTWNSMVEGLPTVITVHTVCGLDYNGNPIPNETEEQCIERHRSKVARLKAAFPPV